MSNESAFGRRTLEVGDPRHGSVGYREFGCRCWTCQVGNRVLKNLEEKAAKELRIEERQRARAEARLRSLHLERTGPQIGFISQERGARARRDREPQADRLFLCLDTVNHGPGAAHWHLRQP